MLIVPRLWVRGILVCTIGALAVACVGELDGSEAEYRRAGSSGGAGGSGGSGGSTAGSSGTAGAAGTSGTGGGGTGNVTCDVPAILTQKCGGSICHGPGNSNGTVDLETAGAESRMVGVTPVCGPDMGGPVSKPLIDSANPANSFFLEKLEPDPSCGDTMPFVGELTADEKACLVNWVQSAAGGA